MTPGVHSVAAHQDAEIEQKNMMLDLVSKVEMFRIVTQKVNTLLVASKKPPVFNLSDINSKGAGN